MFGELGVGNILWLGELFLELNQDGYKQSNGWIVREFSDQEMKALPSMSHSVEVRCGLRLDEVAQAGHNGFIEPTCGKLNTLEFEHRARCQQLLGFYLAVVEGCRRGYGTRVGSSNDE